MNFTVNYPPPSPVSSGVFMTFHDHDMTPLTALSHRPPAPPAPPCTHLASFINALSSFTSLPLASGFGTFMYFLFLVIHYPEFGKPMPCFEFLLCSQSSLPHCCSKHLTHSGFRSLPCWGRGFFWCSGGDKDTFKWNIQTDSANLSHVTGTVIALLAARLCTSMQSCWGGTTATVVKGDGSRLTIAAFTRIFELSILRTALRRVPRSQQHI